MDRNEGNDSQTRPWYKRPWIIVVGFVGCSICLGSVVDDPTTSEVKQTLEDLESYGRVGFDLEETHISQARRRIQTMGWRWSGQDEVAWRQSLQYATVRYSTLQTHQLWLGPYSTLLSTIARRSETTVMTSCRCWA